MNIAIIGFRGTGKTVVSKLLAKKLKRKLVSTDELIIKKTRLSIIDFVNKNGWQKFRDIEEEIVEDVSKLNNVIIDCGGGVVEHTINIKRLKKNSKLVLLTANIGTIIQRIKKSTHRPSLTYNKSFIEEVRDVLNKRRQKYKKAADFSINTSKLTPNQIVDKIKRL